MPEHNGKPTVIDALVCDDIRTEDNGKPILIGVYSGDLIVPEFPVTLMVAFFLAVRLPKGQTTIELRTLIGKVIGPAMRFIAEGPIAGTFYIPTPKVPVSFPEPSEFRLDCRFDEKGRWTNVFTKKIMTSEAFGELDRRLKNEADGESLIKA